LKAVQRYEDILNLQEFSQKKSRNHFQKIVISRYFMLRSIK
jgi:hypothetical protein